MLKVRLGAELWRRTPNPAILTPPRLGACLISLHGPSNIACSACCWKHTRLSLSTLDSTLMPQAYKRCGNSRSQSLSIDNYSQLPRLALKPTATRTAIRRFHVLIKCRAQLEKVRRGGETNLDGGEPRTTLKDVEREIEELGGLGANQRMSSIGQGSDRGGGSKRALKGWFKELGVYQTVREAKKQLQYVRRRTQL